jgi:mono/diheme cytochrome c family protein
VRPDASADAGSPRDGGGGGDAGATRDAGPSADEVAWTQTVKPIAERACFGCHGSVGAASVSLTTHASWVTNRNAIRTRVVTQRNMPPNASSLAAADRAAIATWLGP